MKHNKTADVKEMDKGQSFLGFWDAVRQVQHNNSWQVVNAAGADCRWRNGLEDWLRFFCSFNANVSGTVEGGAR